MIAPKIRRLEFRNAENLKRSSARQASGAPIKMLGNLIKIDNETQNALAMNDVDRVRQPGSDSSMQRWKKYNPIIERASDGTSGMKHRLAMTPSGAKL